MSEIDHIVFDVGQVLLHWDPELIYSDLIPDAVERNAFLAEVCNSEWNLEQDRGRDWFEAEENLIARHPEKSSLIKAYRRDWIKSVPYAHEEIADMMALLIRLGKDVTILSNFNQHTFAEASERYQFLNQPRGATISGRIGLVKPDPQIYNHHVEEFNLNPAKTVFIDDSAANISMARQCGWSAVQFDGREGPMRLQQLLRETGIQLPNS